MSRQKVIFIISILVVIIGLIVLLVFLIQNNIKPQGEKTSQTVSRSQGETLLPGQEGNFLAIEPVVWTDPENPSESPVLKPNEVPQDAVVILIDKQGFSPSVFEVQKGEKVILSLTNQDEKSHSFRFKHAKLKEVAIGAGPGQTLAITFFAPEQTGEYEFYCDMKGHQEMGEKGKMVVK